MISGKKTLWETLFPGKIHKHAQKNEKINQANKTILRIILFYLIENTILIKIRDFQFVRNISEIAKRGETPPAEVIQDLRNLMVVENLIVIMITTIISVALLYYFNNKMSKGSQ